MNRSPVMKFNANRIALDKVEERLREVNVEIVNDDISKGDLDHIVELYKKNKLSELDKLGNGAFGTVYGYGEYAIKRFKKSSIFSNDIEVLKAISHLDAIPTLYAVINEDTVIVERIRGMTVGDYIDKMQYNPYVLNEDTLKQWDEALIDIMLLGYSPKDMHKYNVMVNNEGNIKIVDVGGFRPHNMNIVKNDTYTLKKNDNGYSIAQETTGQVLRNYVKRENARFMAV